MLPRLLAFVVWALAAAGAVAWGFKLFATPLQAPVETVIASTAGAQDGDWSRLFSVAEKPAALPAPIALPPGDARLRLVGVVAPHSRTASTQGVALISIDGKSPRALRVGAVVEGEQVLQRVEARAATIGPRGGPPSLRLELPPLPPPATGTPGAAQLPSRPPMPPVGAITPAPPTAPAVGMLPSANPSPSAPVEEAGAVETAPQAMPPAAAPAPHWQR